LGQTSLGQENVPQKSQFFQFLSWGWVKKYSRQSWISPLSIAGQKYAWLGSWLISIIFLED